MKEFIDAPGDPLAGIDEAIAALRAAWAAGGDGSLLPASALKGSHLIAVNDALGLLQRRTSAAHAPVAAGIMRESRPELGSEGLAKQQGFRNPAVLIAATTGSSTGDAQRLVKVGEAIAPRTTLTGEAAPRGTRTSRRPTPRATSASPRLRPSSRCSIVPRCAPIGSRSMSRNASSPSRRSG